MVILASVFCSFGMCRLFFLVAFTLRYPGVDFLVCLSALVGHEESRSLAGRGDGSFENAPQLKQK